MWQQTDVNPATPLGDGWKIIAERRSRSQRGDAPCCFAGTPVSDRPVQCLTIQQSSADMARLVYHGRLRPVERVADLAPLRPSRTVRCGTGFSLQQRHSGAHDPVNTFGVDRGPAIGFFSHPHEHT